MDGHQRAVHHPVALLVAAGSVFGLAGAFMKPAWLQQSTSADRETDWRSRLRRRAVGLLC